MGVPWRTRARLYPLLLVAVGFVLAAANDVEAQIWVIIEADGTQRFSSAPEPGAKVYLHTRSGTSAPAISSAPYGSLIAQAAADSGVDPGLVRAVIAAESNFDPDAMSPKGARGLMQLMPATARQMGVKDIWDPDQNIRGGTAYLSMLLARYEDVSLALAAYNAGPGAVEKYHGVPPFAETQSYVRKVLGFYRRVKSGAQ